MAHVLSGEALIKEILDLRRVPRRLRTNAKSRLEKLSLAELQTRLLDLREQRRVVDDWADSIGRFASRGPGSCESVLEPESPEAIPSFWQVLKSRSRIEQNIGPPIKESISGRALAIGCQRGSDAGIGQQFGWEATERYCKSALREIIENVVATPSLPDWRPAHPVASHISMEELLIGIGRIENDIEFNKPNVMVGINSQGLSVAKIMKDLLKIDCRLIEIKGAANTHLENLSSFERMADCVVCVVGHVVHSGDTMRTVIEEAKVRFQTEKVYGATIAASKDALNGRLKGRDIVYHQEAVGQDVSLAVGQPSSFVKGGDIILQTPNDGRFTVDGETLELFKKLALKKIPAQVFRWHTAGGESHR